MKIMAKPTRERHLRPPRALRRRSRAAPPGGPKSSPGGPKAAPQGGKKAAPPKAPYAGGKKASTSAAAPDRTQDAAAALAAGAAAAAAAAFVLLLLLDGAASPVPLTPRKLLDANFALTPDEVMPQLLEQPGTVVGILGFQGVGKSRLMSLLAGAGMGRGAGARPRRRHHRAAAGRRPPRPSVCAPDARDGAPRRPPDLRRRGAGDVGTADPPRHAAAALAVGARRAPRLARRTPARRSLPTSNRTRMLLELQSLRLALFVLSVCHVVIFVHDQPLDAPWCRFVRAAHMLRHQLPDLSTVAGAARGAAAAATAAAAAAPSAAACQPPRRAARSRRRRWRVCRRRRRPCSPTRRPSRSPSRARRSPRLGHAPSSGAPSGNSSTPRHSRRRRPRRRRAVAVADGAAATSPPRASPSSSCCRLPSTRRSRPSTSATAPSAKPSATASSALSRRRPSRQAPLRTRVAPRRLPHLGAHHRLAPPRRVQPRPTEAPHS